LDAFRGEIEQVPSMFSAVKHHGKPLYKLARLGIEIEREARPVTIHSNDIVAFEGTGLTLDIHCSKGTYVRTIAHDLGEALGCGAHVDALRRTQAGPYGEDDLATLEEIETAHLEHRLDDMLRPVASTVGQWPEVALTGAPAFYLKQGQPVLVPHAPTAGWVRLVEGTDSEGTFIGVGEILDDGRVAPRRLIVKQ
jgi:tRNA pseudouridine55 synthase